MRPDAVAVQEFRLPDVGEGLTEAEILRWYVAPGDEVHLNMVVVEIETAKSAVELPSPFSGTVVDILVGEGETVEVGSVLFTVAPQSQPPQTAPEQTAVGSTGERVPPAAVSDGSHSVLVGYGPTTAAVRRRPRSQGTVTHGDVRAHRIATVEEGDNAPALLTIADSADDVRIPVRGVRKATAQAMVASAFTAPHVTEFLTVDVTATMDLVARLRQDSEFTDTKVTPLLIVTCAVLAAVRKYPQINASWDEENHEIVQKAAVNLGIAAATPRGLIVPNIKRADRLSLPDLARALANLTTVARQGKTAPEEMTGGTFTITNVGVFGIDAATPILNPGEAAILCFGAVRQMPWVHEGQVVPRWTTQLSLSFDHRLVDGELGSRVLATIGSVLVDPLSWLVTK